MAKDAVDFAIGLGLRSLPSITDEIPLVGAEGSRRSSTRPVHGPEVRLGRPQMVDHLLGRYGSILGDIVALFEADPSLGEPLEHAPPT